MVKIIRQTGIMEPETIRKNGAGLKSRVSRGMLLAALTIIVLLTTQTVFSQTSGISTVRTSFSADPQAIENLRGCGCGSSGMITGIGVGGNATTKSNTPLRIKPVDVVAVSDAIKTPVLKSSSSQQAASVCGVSVIKPLGGVYNPPLVFTLAPYDGTTLINPFSVHIGITVNSAPVNVKYSMYTYKPTFFQSGKRNYIQGLSECEPGPTDPPIATMADVNAHLDKIYEFPVVNEMATGVRYFDWDGYTDPQFTGQKYQVRDCVYLIAQNADTGDFLGLAYTDTTGYTIGNGPLIYTAGEKTISAEIILGYDDNQPIKKITAAIMTENCGWGALPYSVVNQGAAAMLDNINSRLPGDVLAYTELTNPTVDPNNSYVKTFEWTDITGIDGKPFIPKQGQQYIMNFIEETDIQTVTGINAGSMTYSPLMDVPSPTNLDGINKVNADKDVQIAQVFNGYKVSCANGACPVSFEMYDTSGNCVYNQPLTENSGDQTVSVGAQSGKNMYIIIVRTKDNKVYTKKVVGEINK